MWFFLGRSIHSSSNLHSRLALHHGKRYNVNRAVIAIFSLSLGSIGYFTIVRRKWAFITLTVLTLNPIMWIANGIYKKNRSDEFKEEKNDRSHHKHTVDADQTDMLKREEGISRVLRRVRARMNKTQSTIVAVVGNIILFVIAYVILNAIVKNESSYTNPITNKMVWFGWVLYMIPIGLANYLWFKDRNDQ